MATKGKKAPAKKAGSKEILFLHVTKGTKAWLKELCAKEIGTVSVSTKVERILAVYKAMQK